MQSLRRWIGAGASATALLLGASAASPAVTSTTGSVPPFEDGTVLVGFQPETSLERKEAIETAAGASHVRTIGAGTHVLRVGKGRVLSAIAELKGHREVRYAEPNYIVYADRVPNDPSFAQQWALRNTGQELQGVNGTPGADIEAVPAWDIATGAGEVVVGVVDTGIDYNQPDLAANMWSNPGGVGGCPVGSHGYNADSSNPSRDPCDPKAISRHHGTMIASIIGAVGNNAIGIVGVNWATKIMALKFQNEDCLCGTNADAIVAIDFAVQAKQAGVNVRVLNNSYGCCHTGGGKFPYSDAMLDEIEEAGRNDILFVASAGNLSANNDTDPHYPCSYGDPKAIQNPLQTAATNVICVAATDQSDNLAEFSNFGVNSVDVGAPGVNILSALICPPYCSATGSYGYGEGTSMAVPHVVGAAALVLSTRYQPVADLRSTILGSVEPLSPLSGRVKTGGRLNVCRALGGCGADTTPPAAPTGLVVTDAGLGRTLDLDWADTTEPDLAGYNVYRTSDSPAAPSRSWVKANGSLVSASAFRDTGLTDGTPYYYAATAVDRSGNESGRSSEASGVPSDRTAPAAPQSLTAVAGDGQVALDWGDNTEPDLARYTVYRTTDPPTAATRTWTAVATVTVSNYSDAGLVNGTTYYYRLTATDATGNESGPSNEASATPKLAQTKSYAPTSVTISKGSPSSDSARLAASDDVYYQVNSAKQGKKHVVDWYGEAAIDVAGIRKLTTTYEGSYTRQVTQTLYVFNFSTGTWEQVASASVSTTDQPFTWSTTSPAAYISPTGQVRLRVVGSNGASFTCKGDLMGFRVEY